MSKQKYDYDWVEERDGIRVGGWQVKGNSGEYIIEVDLETREIIRDDRPWQMQGGGSHA